VAVTVTDLSVGSCSALSAAKASASGNAASPVNSQPAARIDCASLCVAPGMLCMMCPLENAPEPLPFCDDSACIGVLGIRSSE
jgi:hypothetical protein